MRITIELDSQTELEKKSALFRTLEITTIAMTPLGNNIQVIKGDKKIDPQSLFHIWKKNPKTLSEIRKAGWQRK